MLKFKFEVGISRYETASEGKITYKGCFCQQDTN